MITTKQYLSDPTATTKYIAVTTFWKAPSSTGDTLLPREWTQVAQISHHDTWEEAMRVVDSVEPHWAAGTQTARIASYRQPAYDLDERFTLYKVTLDAIAKPNTTVADSYNTHSYRPASY